MLVSIFMPTKNRRVSLSGAIDSVLRQSHQELELLVVNEASTDDTREYLDDLAARDARVRPIHNQESTGACAARNRAINAARGEFITGLDDDDRFHESRIKSFVDYWATLESCGEQFSCLYAQDTVQRGGQALRSQKMSSATLEQLHRRNVIGNQIFVRRALVVEVGGFDESLVAWEDLDLFMRVIARAGPARLLDASTYWFDDEPRPDRMSRRPSARIVEGSRQVIAKHPESAPRLKQELVLQRYSDFYRIYPTWDQITEFFSYGLNARNLIFLARALDPRRRGRA
jgi:glycosyltransferase involved in cell wall biosynthesis